MTKQEAIVFVGLQPGVDIEEFMETKVFEEKMWFVKQAMVPKVWVKRLDRIKKWLEAWRIITDESAKPIDEAEVVYAHSDNLRDVFVMSHQRKASFQSQLMGVFTLEEIIHVTSAYLTWYKLFIRTWDLTWCQRESEGIKLSQEPDVMEVLTALSLFEKSGGKTIADAEHYAKGTLRTEIIRLSLLAKMS